ncbi:MAG: uroporphyrinogen decarboxylase family protein [Armatimonadia bacterium]
MSGRDCLNALLDRQGALRLCWTTLVDDTTRSVMPPDIRALPVLDFYRYLGCAHLQFGNYGLPPDLQVQPPCRRVEPETRVERTTDDLGTLHVRLETDWGPLHSTFRNGHPLKHPIETLDEIRIARALWERSHYEEVEGSEVTFHRTAAVLGDDGLYAPTLGPSPVQQLLEMDMGLINFYGLLQDYPREVESLLDVMHAVRRQEWEITARRSPARLLITVENTSSTMISPALYRRYSVPQLRDFADLCHTHGKLAVFHMCGLLRDLLPDIMATGLDGAHATTPPPHGDTTLEHALDVCGEDFLLLGGIFDGSIFQAPEVSKEQIIAALDALYTPRLRRANLLLALGADGLPTPLWRFEVVREWFERQSP